MGDRENDGLALLVFIANHFLCMVSKPLRVDAFEEAEYVEEESLMEALKGIFDVDGKLSLREALEDIVVCDGRGVFGWWSLRVI